MSGSIAQLDEHRAALVGHCYLAALLWVGLGLRDRRVRALFERP